jgi:hypothetical protein
MKQYHIFHATSPLRFTETQIQPREYTGFVYANSIEHAFTLSQNDENVWNTANPCRSTSVGDIIQDGDKFFMVCGTGFKELVEPEEEEDLATMADREEEAKYQQ